jgi:hypothetical protein
MAHFAEIDIDNKVIRVLVVPNDYENRGAEYLANDLHLGGTWVQTSYNGNSRYNYAGIGYTYDAVNDAFIAPKPECGHSELSLSTATYRWGCANAEHEIEL